MAANTTTIIISTAAAAELIGCTPARVLQLLRHGDLKGQKLNARAWAVDQADAHRVANQPYTTGRPRTRP